MPSVVQEALLFPFENTYTRLPERFFAKVDPVPVAEPRLLVFNDGLAERLGLNSKRLKTPGGVACLAGNLVPKGARPAALAYAGHQFAYFVPQLGDGRANLLGEVVGRDGVRYDIQLKGSGRTPFSRGGDGRAALGPVLREYLVSEAMAALGVPTTRSLAAVATGEVVMRETPRPGAVLTRVARSHLRVGTFQYFAARKDVEAVQILADYALERHFPEVAGSPRRYRAFLDAAIEGQARLVCQWMLLGFVHGVMNTDNVSIAGETLDYGPCAFLEAYDPATVFSSIDRQGRYDFGNQPQVALWNLTRLAESLLPVLSEEAGSEEAGLASAKEALGVFPGRFKELHLAGLRKKTGLLDAREGDEQLVEDLLNRMAANGADFTLTFRGLCLAAESGAGDAEVRKLFTSPEAFDEWAGGWRRRLEEETVSAPDRAREMRAVNPMFIPRNHRVEEALRAAEGGDLGPFGRLLEVVSRPYEEQPGAEEYSLPARPEEAVHATFCGT